LLAERTVGGYWEGELAHSALATAVALSALAEVGRQTDLPQAHAQPIAAGLEWLAQHQNPDGGWGDTPRSFSNISTTLLVRAAFTLTGKAEQYATVIQRCEHWLHPRYGATPTDWAAAVRARYGRDRTFAVPILATLAVAKLIDWREVPALPFELACLPQSWYRFARLPVVSYALPALIAIGQGIAHHRPAWNPLLRGLRAACVAPSLRVLTRIQPPNGGFLEATPLTAFVTLHLAASGRATHEVVHRGVQFLSESMRPDGSWPIDSNLSVWVTTLSVNALAAGGDLAALGERSRLTAWLLERQYRTVHPYTGAAPGAWSWTHLPGGVPDGDDTPGALLALAALGVTPGKWLLPAIHWLLDLQNSDGGWPTFCRGWSGLPFDRSGTDLTAHALRALHCWRPVLSVDVQRAIDQATARGWRYLAQQQRRDGSWLPLWFGNQFAPDDLNPVYGTARVLMAYRDLGQTETLPAQRGVNFLLVSQDRQGAWGGTFETPASIEETAVVVEALQGWPATRSAWERGADWLAEAVGADRYTQPTPIGFYFAKLWYYEKLYPLAFAVAALGRAIRR
jgi:squalene-hopene/tetraprenyl-beta-curcumene cyclase